MSHTYKEKTGISAIFGLFVAASHKTKQNVQMKMKLLTFWTLEISQT